MAYIALFSFEKSFIVSSLLPELKPFPTFYDLSPFSSKTQ